MNQSFRAILGTCFMILLLGGGIILFTNSNRFSFLWFIGVFDYLITSFIMLYINYRFICWNDKEMKK